MFKYLATPRNITQYTLMRGVTDFGNLEQFNLFETGYSFLVVIGVPVFLEKLGAVDSNYQNLLNIYTQILENEFRGLSGLEDISTDPVELTNGISTLNIIAKVNEQSQSNVSFRFFEKMGTPITRMHEFFLKGIKDSRTEIKTYHGLIDGVVGGVTVDKLEPGYENEVFTFLYFVTDNSVSKIERAYLLLNAQPTKAETTIYESEKGTIESKEITAEFNCFAVTGDVANLKASEYLAYMLDSSTIASKRLIKSSTDFAYTVQQNASNLPSTF